MKIKDERAELEKMINESTETIGKEADDTPELQMDPTFDIDFNKLQKECDKKAKKLVHNATGFMLTDMVVKENPYLKNKS